MKISLAFGGSIGIALTAQNPRLWTSFDLQTNTITPLTMIDLSDYTAVFPTDGRNPYQANDVREIENFRKKFDGVLFIDRVLQALGIAQGGTE